MWLNKKNTTNSEIKWQSENESQRKANLTQNFSESKNSELIEKEYEALPKMIENLIKENFLKKEFYENLPDWSNPEIDNVCNHSALDIENRVKEGKWILYMNPCITQTLYFVNKIKKHFPHLSKYTDLSVEILKLSKLNIHSVHSFIQIKIPNHEPIIIDFAHDNDVYIYQWLYTNRSSHAIKTESTISVPIKSFSDKDTIFDIAVKWHMLSEGDFDSSQELHDDFFSWILNSRKEQLKSNNTKIKFERWQEKNKEIRIFNLLRS
jgi:hypothetical protein